MTYEDDYYSQPQRNDLTNIEISQYQAVKKYLLNKFSPYENEFMKKIYTMNKKELGKLSEKQRQLLHKLAK